MKMLFHYPGPFHERLDSGEKKRPVMMKQAFERIGHEVVTVTGERSERARQWREIAPALGSFDFMYSENSTLPLGLTGPKHLPTVNPVDYQIFRAAKQQGLPVGVFYRDVYWKFKSFQQDVGGIKMALAKRFYAGELKLYRETCRRVFVPSEPFKKQLPEMPQELMSCLPPACDLPELQKRGLGKDLWLVYVGSIRPPIYDISPILEAMRRLGSASVNLTICTRPGDFEECSEVYDWPDGVSVVHYVGEQLADLLQAADISLMCFPRDPYRDLAMPLKLFEAIGFGLPVIATGPNAVSQFVDAERIGWEIQPHELADLIGHLLKESRDLRDAQERVLAIRPKHTWDERARQVVTELMCEPEGA